MNDYVHEVVPGESCSCGRQHQLADRPSVSGEPHTEREPGLAVTFATGMTRAFSDDDVLALLRRVEAEAIRRNLARAPTEPRTLLFAALKRMLEHFEWYAPDNDETDDVKGQAIKALRLAEASTGAALDGERLYRTYWRTQWDHPGIVGYKPARQWEQLQPEEQAIWNATAARLAEQEEGAVR